MNKQISLFLLFFFLLFLQVFILNNILFLGHINPYLYIVFVFAYPIKETRFLFLFIAFLLGLFVDFFSDSGGIHAFSILFIAYIRLILVKIFFKKTAIDFPLFNLQAEPFGKVFNYTIVLTLIHHFLLFSFANFSFQNIGTIFFNTIVSSIFTLILFFLGAFIFRKNNNKI